MKRNVTLPPPPPPSRDANDTISGRQRRQRGRRALRLAIHVRTIRAGPLALSRSRSLAGCLLFSFYFSHFLSHDLLLCCFSLFFSSLCHFSSMSVFLFSFFPFRLLLFFSLFVFSLFHLITFASSPSFHVHSLGLISSIISPFSNSSSSTSFTYFSISSSSSSSASLFYSPSLSSLPSSPSFSLYSSSSSVSKFSKRTCPAKPSSE